MTEKPSYEQKSEMEYDALLKLAFSNVRKNFDRDIGREKEKKILFSEIEGQQAESIADGTAAEALEDVSMAFQVMRYSITVRDAILYDTLTRIDEKARNIVLMSFWLEMTDREIAEETGLKRRTVNNIRNKTYQELKKILEAEGYEAGRFFPTYKQ